MRSDKILLGLLFIYIENDNDFVSMCCCTHEMVNKYAYDNELKGTEISVFERKKLRNYLIDNKPKEIQNSYWWNKGEKQRRLKWLKEEIFKINKILRNGKKTK